MFATLKCLYLSQETKSGASKSCCLGGAFYSALPLNAGAIFNSPYACIKSPLEYGNPESQNEALGILIKLLILHIVFLSRGGRGRSEGINY